MLRQKQWENVIKYKNGIIVRCMSSLVNTSADYKLPLMRWFKHTNILKEDLNIYISAYSSVPMSCKYLTPWLDLQI